MRGSHLLTCLVLILCLSSLAGCTGSTPSPSVTPTSIVPSATPVPTAVPTLAATATPERKDRIALWDSGYWYLLGVTGLEEAIPSFAVTFIMVNSTWLVGERLQKRRGEAQACMI